jgi:hypothetical protein
MVQPRLKKIRNPRNRRRLIAVRDGKSGRVVKNMPKRRTGCRIESDRGRHDELPALPRSHPQGGNEIQVDPGGRDEPLVVVQRKGGMIADKSLLQQPPALSHDLLVNVLAELFHAVPGRERDMKKLADHAKESFTL